MKKLFKIVLLTALNATPLFSCADKDKDIVVLYSTDVHCAIDENIGYSALAERYTNNEGRITIL